MNNIELPVVQIQNDIGVIVNQGLKTIAHYPAVAGKTLRMLRPIRWAFSHVSVDNLSPLYKDLVHPKIKQCIQDANFCQIWGSMLLWKVHKIKNEQISEIVMFPYDDKLVKINLFHLSRKRTRGDEISYFNYIMITLQTICPRLSGLPKQRTWNTKKFKSSEQITCQLSFNFFLELWTNRIHQSNKWLNLHQTKDFREG